jgi:branched-chain amino acid transport system substrate-binding protein
MSTLLRALLAILASAASLGAISDRTREEGVTDSEIRIGNIMPYSGPLKLFGEIGKAESAYFEMLNERGGIGGRKIRFISYDDKSDALTALRAMRTLVEDEKVLLMFGSFGTPGNFASRKYLNQNSVPQLFVASGDDHLSDPSSFPWTMGWQPSFREEGRIYANYIQAYYPGKRIVVLWQNDYFGQEIIRGLQDGLGEVAKSIRVGIAYDLQDEHLDTHLSILKQAGADILVFAGVPSNAAKVVKLTSEMKWRPVLIMNQMASSIKSGLLPAGAENAQGVITAAYLKDAGDPAWKGDKSSADWASFLEKYRLAGGTDEGAAMFGYAAAETLAKVLTKCGAELSRENVMKQAASLKDYQSSALLPGITISTGPSNFRPIKNLRLLQFDGRTWQPVGDILETAFVGAER